MTTNECAFMLNWENWKHVMNIKTKVCAVKLKWWWNKCEMNGFVYHLNSKKENLFDIFSQDHQILSWKIMENILLLSWNSAFFPINELFCLSLLGFHFNVIVFILFMYPATEFSLNYTLMWGLAWARRHMNNRCSWRK